jgi:hypothetical protein
MLKQKRAEISSVAAYPKIAQAKHDLATSMSIRLFEGGEREQAVQPQLRQKGEIAISACAIESGRATHVGWRNG